MNKPGPTKAELLRRVSDLEQRLQDAESTIKTLRRDAAGAQVDATAMVRDLDEHRRVDDLNQQVLEELGTANEELQVQAEELQVQTEELRVQAEELLTQNEELERLSQDLETERALLRTVLEQMPGGVIVAEAPSGFFHLVNKQLEAVLGRLVSMADCLGNYHHFQGLRPDGSPYQPQDYPLARCLTQGEKISEEEISIIRGDDSRGVVMVNAAPVRNGKGEIIAAVATYRDITVRKQQEREILRQASFPQVNPNPVLEADTAGRITYFNQAARETIEKLGGAAAISDFLPGDFDEIVATARMTGEKDFRREVQVADAHFLVTVSYVETFNTVRIYAIDITQRKRAEAALIRAKQEWERTFNALPDLIAILDNEHRIVRVNRPMAEALGKEPQDLVGQFCYEQMHQSVCPPDICPHSRLLQDGQGHAAELREFDLDLLVTVSPILDDQGRLLGSVHVARDITERKRAENILAARLRLLKFAESHSLEEFTQATLDESEALTGSAIGFYHLVEADQRTLSLQSWSTNTLLNMCSAEGSGQHYDIAEAGVWVDCVHQRRPVIHNNYEALPHRKGMPAGHAAVAREMVVPIFRGGKIVAIIGVGNKPADYDDRDVEVVSFLGDLSWDITERKRAEAALQQAHNELEHRVAARTAELKQTVAQLQEEVGDRQRAEKQAENLGRLYQVLSRVNEIIVRVSDRDTLFREACRIAVEDGGLRMAWVGLIDPEDQVVKVAAQYGHDQGYLDNLVISLEDVPGSHGPTGVAVREGRFDLCNDFAAEPRMAPWREKARARGYRSSGAFPLRLGSEVVGAITIYAERPNFFNQEEIGLMEALADDLSFAMESMEREAGRRKAEQEIQKLNEELEARVRERTAQLEAANQELEAFSYSVSHDLKAPIRAIDGFSRMLMLEHASQLDAEALRLLEVIRHNTDFMARLIDDLLALSRLGRHELRKAWIDLAAMSANAFKELKAQAPGRHLDLTINELPPAFGDPSLLNQVLVNLLTNACKYTKFEETASIEVGGRRAAGENVYYVKDNGVGFDMRFENKLFGVFQRLHGGTDFEGTGVGLAIVQRILQRHGGRVWAEGKVGEGATFYFALPMAQD